MKKTESVWPLIEPHLTKVERPSRYINHEYNAYSGSPRQTNDHSCHTDNHLSHTRDSLCHSRAGGNPSEHSRYRAAFLYPDTYEIGQSNAAIAILYQLVNTHEGCSAERVFLPWLDMIDVMRKHDIPLFALESATPVAGFDMFGITLPHTLAATNILEAIDLAGIPIKSCDRTLEHPLVVGGGPEAFNPEPLSSFFDAFMIGEGEEVLLEFVDTHRRCLDQRMSKAELLLELSKIEGVYIPSLYKLDHNALRPKDESIPTRINKRVIKDFDKLPPVTDPIVPFAEVAHDRLTIELLRGCTRGCRFCQAGMIYRPVRERSADMIIDSVARGLACTGFDEVSLVSLSSTDHSQIEQILKRLHRMLSGTGVGISLPSQRLDAFGIDMARLVAGEKKTGLTFAPEAGTQRLRDIINKNVTEKNLIDAVEQAYAAGWRRCKLYFMIGLPGETDEDIIGIAELANRAYAAAKDSVPDGQRGNVRMTVSVAVFVPKSHTPFQWGGQIAREEIDRRITVLRNAKMHKGIDLSWHDPATSRIEAAISRAGREASTLIEEVWRQGAKFDAWSERFNELLWENAADAVGLDISAMAERNYSIEEPLPWDHISCGVSKKFLAKEYDRSLAIETSTDCSFDRCIACGVCTDLDVDIKLGGESRA